MNFSRLLAQTAIVTSLCAVTPAFAQSDDTAEQTDTGIGDIVVTAQRKEQKLQNVPVAVTALSGDSLETRGISDLSDLNTAAPNLNVSRSVKGQVIFLRGVGNVTTSPGQEQNVAVYVDGVYYPSTAGAVFSFDDIQRIEVLRGPQGTLYGRNTTGGLVHIVTADPSDTFEGKLRFGYANYNTVEAGAQLSGPLSDTVRASIGGKWTKQYDGWGTNVTTGEDTFKSEEVSVHGKLVFEPSTATKFTLGGIFARSRSQIGIIRTQLPCTPNYDGSCVPIQVGQTSLQNVAYPGFFNSQSGLLDPHDINRMWTVSGKFEQDVNFAQLSATVAYQNIWNDERIDTDTVKPLIAQSLSNEKSHSFSSELLLSSPAGSAIEWVGGIYYFHALAKNDPFNIQVAGGAVEYTNYSAMKTDSLSGFGQVTVPLGERTKLTAGARYTVDWRSMDASQTSGVGGALIGGPTHQEATFKRPTFKVSIDHKLNDDALIYALVATGFKSGLWNTTSPIPNNPAVQPETLTDYEAGLKLDLFNRRVRLNLAGFYYDYKNLQQLAYIGQGAVQTILLNAANARIYGAEADFEGRLTDRLTFRASGGYTDSKYKSFPGAPLTVVNLTTGLPSNVAGGFNAAGLPLSRVAKFTGNVGFDYEMPAFGGSLVTSASLYHNSGFNWEIDGRLHQQPYELVNASLNWTDASDQFSVRLWTNNLTNTKYYVTINNGNNRPDAPSPAAPRTYGVTTSFKF